MTAVRLLEAVAPASAVHEHVLDGCAPVPLAHYLKALAVLRLVGEQKDPEARGAWRGHAFVLQTSLDRKELLRFFLNEYEPTPIVAPWNGGSGFAAGDNQKAIQSIEQGTAPRLSTYRETIGLARMLFARIAGDKKVDKDNKAPLQLACRNALPDAALGWLDATFVLTEDGPKYPPLLGTGGNDGRLDFTNNFMQRLVDVIDPASGAPQKNTDALLESALFGTPARGLTKAAVGQFSPGSAGGANATAGFDGEALVNPWDFVLMLEGAVAFAAAAVKRLGDAGPGVPSVPFTVRASGVGYGSAAGADANDSRGELWLPTWSRPVRAAELLHLLGEGRAQVRRRPARHGIDFARAVASLGVDRGLDAFQRYGFHVRNGLAYFATPLGRVPVRAEPRVRLLDEIDGWLETLRRSASGDRTPASVTRAVNGLDRAVLELCRDGGPRSAQEVLAALGALEAQLATSLRWTTDSRLPPIPSLSPQWVVDADDGSPEWRLAASLASLYHPKCGSLRPYLEPVQGGRRADGSVWARWDDKGSALLQAVWQDGDLTRNLGLVLDRWLLTAESEGATSGGLTGRVPAQLDDVAAFLDGAVDDERLASLVWGLALVRWNEVRHVAREPKAPEIDPGYALLKLCVAGHPVRGVTLPLQKAIVRRALAGDLAESTPQASRRLRASGLVPAVDVVAASPDGARRRAAVLLFPLSPASLERLALTVLRSAAGARQESRR